MSALTSKDLAAVARRWIEDYRRAPSIKQGWRLVRILERVLADRAEVERAAAEKAWDEGCKAALREWNEHSRGAVNNPALNPYRRNEGENE